jgi:hypothetical protein
MARAAKMPVANSNTDATSARLIDYLHGPEHLRTVERVPHEFQSPNCTDPLRREQGLPLSKGKCSFAQSLPIQSYRGLHPMNVLLVQ